MSVVATGIARIRHADSGEIYTVLPEELDWNVDGMDERQMGPELTHAADVSHPELGELTWRLWEYPVGMENDREVDVGRHQLLETFSLSLDQGSDDALEARVDALTDWFFQRYEDPAQHTPYITAEGGYQWIRGGPFDARDVLNGSFPDENEQILSAAVDRIEESGLTEWAPVPGPDDYDDYMEPPPEAATRPLVPNEAPETNKILLHRLRSLAQPTSGALFAEDADGRVELLGWTQSPDATDGPLLRELQGLSADLTDLLDGTNGHQDLLKALQRYREAIGQKPVSISWLYARGVFLENVAQQAETEIVADDRPPLTGQVQGSLKALLQLMGRSSWQPRKVAHWSRARRVIGAHRRRKNRSPNPLAAFQTPCRLRPSCLVRLRARQSLKPPVKSARVRIQSAQTSCRSGC